MDTYMLKPISYIAKYVTKKDRIFAVNPTLCSESILTHACNNWATNNASNTLTFTNERNQFLKFLDERNIKNIIFLTTDVHYAATVKVSQEYLKTLMEMEISSHLTK